MVKIKKALWTLNIDYCKEITDLTYPFLRKYADKIGAEFGIISERRFPEYPIVYEKLQLYKLAKQYDWTIYVDSDALIHPDFFDVTEHIDKATVVHNGCDMAGNRWKYDNYFRRDGRNIGSCNWFTIASDWCRDLWKPLESNDMTCEEAIGNIHPILSEWQTVITPEHLIDDYVLSRNIARYGLKFQTVNNLVAKLDPTGNYLWHQYCMTPEEKIHNMKRIISEWGLEHSGLHIELAATIKGFMTRPELLWLAENARNHSTIIEIGSYYGRSTRALADNTPGKVYCIDDFYGPRDVMLSEDERKNIHQSFNLALSDHLSTGKVEVLDTNVANKLITKTPLMIFIDGDHNYNAVIADIKYAKSIIHSVNSGMICGHDIDIPSVQRAINDSLPGYQRGYGSLWWINSKAL